MQCSTWFEWIWEGKKSLSRFIQRIFENSVHKQKTDQKFTWFLLKQGKFLDLTYVHQHKCLIPASMFDAWSMFSMFFTKWQVIKNKINLFALLFDGRWRIDYISERQFNKYFILLFHRKWVVVIHWLPWLPWMMFISVFMRNPLL